MSAKVTSVDISDEQLKVARERAAELGLDIRFLRARRDQSISVDQRIRSGLHRGTRCRMGFRLTAVLL
jgi:hypothetical protein